MKGFTQFTLAALAACVSAVSVNLNKRVSPLSIVLSKSGNTEVNVAITNNGNKTLNLLSKGTFLDEVNPVERVSVYSNSGSKSVLEPETKSQLGYGGVLQKLDA
jgi:deuterolysin